jgi:hypothetical protein
VMAALPDFALSLRNSLQVVPCLASRSVSGKSFHVWQVVPCLASRERN